MDSLNIPNIKKTKFKSFDGNIEIISQHQHPNKLHDLEQISKDVIRITRGGGYSYTASSFGKNILTQEMTSFDHILENGGIWHLWGHSWEIEKNNDWSKLKNIFEYIKLKSKNNSIEFLTNGEIFKES